jgi:hypothetical protein
MRVGYSMIERYFDSMETRLKTSTRNPSCRLPKFGSLHEHVGAEPLSGLLLFVAHSLIVVPFGGHGSFRDLESGSCHGVDRDSQVTNQKCTPTHSFILLWISEIMCSLQRREMRRFAIHIFFPREMVTTQTSFETRLRCTSAQWI